MDKTVIGVLHPGEMGAAVAACLSRPGLTVLWASAGRGADSAARAAAGMRDAGTAGEISELFAGTALDARVVGDEPGASPPLRRQHPVRRSER